MTRPGGDGTAGEAPLAGDAAATAWLLTPAFLGIAASVLGFFVASGMFLPSTRPRRC